MPEDTVFDSTDKGTFRPIAKLILKQGDTFTLQLPDWDLPRVVSFNLERIHLFLSCARDREDLSKSPFNYYFKLCFIKDCLVLVTD